MQWLAGETGFGCLVLVLALLWLGDETKDRCKQVWCRVFCFVMKRNIDDIKFGDECYYCCVVGWRNGI